MARISRPLALLLAALLATAAAPQPAAAAVTWLSQADFDAGTYRIQTSGQYKLKEDIVFAPRPDNDYWNDPSDPNYPILQFYMGFFAALTIETDDVDLNLNGHSIVMGKEFHLLQRFFNVIELNDRVFVDNEGVSSLNVQEGDKQHPPQTGTLQRIKTASNVYIHDGTIGLSSHIGIHGNGAKNIRIHNVEVRDFEVAGIQCNGCENLDISGCVVGPASHSVPVSGNFASVRFVNLYTQRFIPSAFASMGIAHLLTDTEVHFHDRSPASVEAVFARLHRAETLFRDAYMDRLPGTLSADDQALLEETQRAFANPSGLTDGGVVYGILINQLGVPHSDQNFRGGMFAEAKNIKVANTKVVGLHARPKEVPSLQTNDGSWIQGPHRDLFHFVKVSSDNVRTLFDSRYAGDALHDAYFAFWKLSNSFYNTFVYESSCGNFGSNGTLDYQFASTAAGGPCTAGVNKNPSLNGRDVSMLQKRFFGGLLITDGLYDWASQGFGLDKILSTPSFAVDRRNHGHRIGCGHDVMFHALQGVIGIKIFEAYDVSLRNVEVADLHNSADDAEWVCTQHFELRSGEDGAGIGRKASSAAAGVHGIQIVRSEKISLHSVDVHDLTSEEGAVFGIEIMADNNDRSSYADERGVTFTSSTVSRLAAGSGYEAMGIKSDNQQVNTGGLRIDQPRDQEGNFDFPKWTLSYEFSKSFLGDFNGGPNLFAADPHDEYQQAHSMFDTPAKSLAFRQEALEYFNQHFGTEFPEDVSMFPANSPIPASPGSDTFMVPAVVNPEAGYHAVTICSDTTGCIPVSRNSFVHDFSYAIFVGPSGYTFHGTFGGDQGQYSPPGAFVLVGVYSFENLVIPGINEDGNNIEIHYYSQCPVQLDPAGAGELSLYINCALESSLFGRGLATGAYMYKYTAGETLPWEVNGFATMVFDDDVDAPQPSPVKTSELVHREWHTNALRLDVWADGVFQAERGAAGDDTFPLLGATHWTHEAGIQYLQQWTSVSSDEQIRDLREAFLTRLLNDWGIVRVGNPAAYRNMPLDAQIDLGGGNTVMPYVVNEQANLRVFVRIARDDASPPQTRNGESRIHEGGFRVVAGRAGLTTSRGYLPFGSMIVQGVYVIENEPTRGVNQEMSFHSHIALTSNAWSTGVIINDVESPTYGVGAMFLAVTSPMPTSGGLGINIRGAMVFDDLPAGGSE